MDETVHGAHILAIVGKISSILDKKVSFMANATRSSWFFQAGAPSSGVPAIRA
jgi:hypothetical protein